MRPRLKVLTHPNPLLSRTARIVPRERIVHRSTKLLGDALYQLMVENQGIGITAPQVGKDMQYLLVELLQDPALPKLQPFPKTHIFNPRLEFHGTEKIPCWEICLSVPGKVGKVLRHASLSFWFQDDTGQERKLKAHGYIAAMLQHETDHLFGKLFIERIQNPADLVDEETLLKTNPEFWKECGEGSFQIEY